MDGKDAKLAGGIILFLLAVIAVGASDDFRGIAAFIVFGGIGIVVLGAILGALASAWQLLAKVTRMRK
jgi:formate hydrogenlyase subunit 3/multisubunit Na+/H+ antiporter MnhD subunit